MNTKTIFFLIISSLCLFADAQTPGSYDPGFGASTVPGRVADSSITPYTYSAMALGGGNNIVLSHVDGNIITVTRYINNGNRDASFGNNGSGIVRIAIPGYNGNISSSVLLADQSIVLAGNNKISGVTTGFLLKLNDAGVIDSSFGVNGVVYINQFAFSGENISVIKSQGDGKLVLCDIGARTSNDDSVAIIRLNSNGTFDNSFANSGVYLVPCYNFATNNAFYFSVDVYNHAHFASYFNVNNTDNFYITELDANGTPNVLFGQGGVVLINSPNLINNGNNLGLSMQDDGKLVTVQSAQFGPVLYAVCRYNADGSVDTDFGTNGMLSIDIAGGQPFDIHSIAVIGSVKIITAGLVHISGQLQTVVSSINRKGSLDEHFGANGGNILLNSMEYDNRVYNLVVQPDNKILLNGMVNEIKYKFYNLVRLSAPTFTGIDEVAVDNNLEVYPNPTTSEISLNLTAELTEVSIHDISGKLVKRITEHGAGTKHYALNNLAPGVYVVSCKSNAGTTSTRLIKQ